MKQPYIVIVDYDAGNIESVRNAVCTLGYRKVVLSSESNELKKANAIILPGVGAFGECAHNLRKKNLDDILSESVLKMGIPILGICVGMQLLAEFSEEGGQHKGLGWIPGSVRRFDSTEKYPVPHVGWNDIETKNCVPLFAKLDEFPNFYFDHSYYFNCKPENVAAQCNYGVEFAAAIQQDNIFGVQFHPEKSHNNGLKLFRAFLNALI